MNGQRPLKVGDLVDVAFRARVTDANDRDWVMVVAAENEPYESRSFVMVESCTLVDPPISVGTVVSSVDALDRLPRRTMVMDHAGGWMAQHRGGGRWGALSADESLAAPAALTSLTSAEVAAWDRPTVVWLPEEGS